MTVVVVISIVLGAVITAIAGGLAVHFLPKFIELAGRQKAIMAGDTLALRYDPFVRNSTTAAVLVASALMIGAIVLEPGQKARYEIVNQIERNLDYLWVMILVWLLWVWVYITRFRVVISPTQIVFRHWPFVRRIKLEQIEEIHEDAESIVLRLKGGARKATIYKRMTGWRDGLALLRRCHRTACLRREPEPIQSNPDLTS